MEGFHLFNVDALGGLLGSKLVQRVADNKTNEITAVIGGPIKLRSNTLLHIWATGFVVMVDIEYPPHLPL